MNINRMVCLKLLGRFRALRDSCHGQDLIEYALMAALVATGIVSMSPGVAVGISTVWSKVNTIMGNAASY